MKLHDHLGTLIIFIVSLLLLISIAGYVYNLEWTGLLESKAITETKKAFTKNAKNEMEEVKVSKTRTFRTLWDWMNLLIIPSVIALAAFWFKQIQYEVEKKRLKKETDALAYSENQRAQESVLDSYLNQMSEFLLDKSSPLLSSKADSPLREMAFVRTITALRRLDGQKRKNFLIGFLRGNKLLGRVRQRLRLTPSGDTTDPVEDPFSILEGRDLRNIDLSGLNLSYANLNRTDLRGVNLTGVNLRKAKLSKADLRDANLTEADLSGANLSGANCTKAIFHKANFTSATMRGTILNEAYLTESILKSANAPRGPSNPQPSGQHNVWFDEVWGSLELVDAKLNKCHMKGALIMDDVILDNAELCEVNLKEATLRDAKLTLCNANFSSADLTGLDLSSAFMYGAVFNDATLIKTNFSNSRLSNCNFRRADMSGANLSGAELGPKNEPYRKGADFRDALNLICEQLTKAKNWEQAYRDDKLSCGAEIPNKRLD